MPASLTLLKDDKPVSQFAVTGDQPLTVGRSTGNTVQIHDAKISRHHSEIRATPDGYFIRDLGSKNGTFVNGARITEARLRDDDRLQIGLARFVFHCEVSESGEETQVAPPHLCAACGKIVPIDALGSARKSQSRVYCHPCILANPLLGRVIGGYEIVQPIGHGSMGIVFKAEQLSMGRLVALKILHDELTANPQAVARFLREARAGGQISHPNIIRIYDMNQADGFYFISMEYAQGGDVGSLLEREGPLPVKQLLDIAIPTCAALAHAHAAGIVHRDIKPSNLLLTRDGLVKLADLGLAKSLDAAGLTTLTGSGAALGTLLYLPPEQLADAHAVDPRADIYSLGATCYRLLSGEHAYQAATAQELARAIRTQQPRSLRSYREDVSAELDAAIARAMAPDPARRFQTAEELRLALKAVKI